MFNKKYNFDESLTEEELKIIEDTIKEKDQTNPMIVERIMKKHKLDNRENISRAVFNARYILKDRKLKVRGYVKATMEIIQQAKKENKTIIVLDESIFGNSKTELRVREIQGEKYWMQKRRRTHYATNNDLLNKYIKII